MTLRTKAPLAGLLALAAVAVFLRGTGRGVAPVAAGAPAASTATPSAPTATMSPPVTSATSTPAASQSTSPAPPDAAQVARRFVAALLAPSGTAASARAAWLARLRPVTDPQLLDALATTDVRRIPSWRLAPGTVTTVPLTGGDVQAVVPTTGATLYVVLTRAPSGAWRVTTYDRGPA